MGRDEANRGAAVAEVGGAGRRVTMVAADSQRMRMATCKAVEVVAVARTVSR